jgi:hypothetical protein
MEWQMKIDLIEAWQGEFYELQYKKLLGSGIDKEREEGLQRSDNVMSGSFQLPPDARFALINPDNRQEVNYYYSELPSLNFEAQQDEILLIEQKIQENDDKLVRDGILSDKQRLGNGDHIVAQGMFYDDETGTVEILARSVKYSELLYLQDQNGLLDGVRYHQVGVAVSAITLDLYSEAFVHLVQPANPNLANNRNAIYGFLQPPSSNPEVPLKNQSLDIFQQTAVTKLAEEALFTDRELSRNELKDAINPFLQNLIDYTNMEGFLREAIASKPRAAAIAIRRPVQNKQDLQERMWHLEVHLPIIIDCPPQDLRNIIENNTAPYASLGLGKMSDYLSLDPERKNEIGKYLQERRERGERGGNDMNRDAIIASYRVFNNDYRALVEIIDDSLKLTTCTLDVNSPELKRYAIGSQSLEQAEEILGNSVRPREGQSELEVVQSVNDSLCCNIS